MKVKIKLRKLGVVVMRSRKAGRMGDRRQEVRCKDRKAWRKDLERNGY